MLLIGRVEAARRPVAGHGNTKSNCLVLDVQGKPREKRNGRNRRVRTLPKETRGLGEIRVVLKGDHLF